MKRKEHHLPRLKRGTELNIRLRSGVLIVDRFVGRSDRYLVTLGHGRIARCEIVAVSSGALMFIR